MRFTQLFAYVWQILGTWHLVIPYVYRFRICTVKGDRELSRVSKADFRREICRDRQDRRSCKIFPNCVKFGGNNAESLGNYRVIYALNE